MCLVSMNEYNVLLVKGIVGALVEVFLMNAHKYTCAAKNVCHGEICYERANTGSRPLRSEDPHLVQHTLFTMKCGYFTCNDRKQPQGGCS